MQERNEAMLGYIKAGYVLTPLKGKIPLREGWQESLYEIDIDPEEFYAPIKGRVPDNYGIVLQEDDLVIDVDPRNFDTGDKPHVRLFEDFNIPKTEAVIVQTGTGGLHIYFKKDPTVHVKELHADYPGIEFKSKGRQVVGAECIHPDTKKTYKLKQGTFSKVPAAPAELIAALKTTAKKKNEKIEKSAPKIYPNRPDDKARFIELLKQSPVAIEGQQGDLQTYKIACEGRSFDLSPEVCYELMSEHFNPRCMPPWEEFELKKKVDNAYNYAQSEIGVRTPENDFEATASQNENVIDFSINWDRNSNGTLKKTIRNVFNFFFMEACPLYQTVAYDEFQGQVMVVADLPWRDDISAPTQWTDDDSKELRLFLCHKFRLDAPTQLIDEAVLVAAKRKLIHPIRDYLTKLKWDRVKRLDKWLVDYAGVEDNDYSREVGAKLLISAVARVYHPGCKVDSVVVLEGPQGIGKSTLVKALGGEWYADIVVDPHARDTVDAMRGTWFVEFSEMEVTKRADMQALKAFITRQKDRVRLAYGKRSVEYPRQCIFVGTINPDVTGEYLADQTGNRRFLPIAVRGVRVDAFLKVRDQIFAEATDRYMKGEPIFIENKHVLKMASDEQEKRRFHDPWTEIIAEYLETDKLAKDYHFTTIKDLWLYAIKGSEGQMNRLQSHRIAGALRDLGWDRCTRRHPVTRVTVKAFSDKPETAVKELSIFE